MYVDLYFPSLHDTAWICQRENADVRRFLYKSQSEKDRRQAMEKLGQQIIDHQLSIRRLELEISDNRCKLTGQNVLWRRFKRHPTLRTERNSDD